MPDDLKNLEDRIARFQKTGKTETPDKSLGAPDTGSSLNIGMRAGSEFVSHIIAGGMLGWGADYILHTSPLFMLGLLLCGFGTGIWRMVTIMNKK